MHLRHRTLPLANVELAQPGGSELSIQAVVSSGQPVGCIGTGPALSSAPRPQSRLTFHHAIAALHTKLYFLRSALLQLSGMARPEHAVQMLSRAA